ncbi:YihD family protein [Psychromonas arctica]|uniref:YihD family protein n=1 Tax=Psychromonas arctica TaxID=168275 RepID=UPI002FD6610C
MQNHRINEILELIKPYWLKHQDLDLLTLLKQIATESGFDGAIDTLTDEVIIYHLKMDQTEKNEMIPGIAKDCEDDFQSALLKARGLL